jgi:hypothetical protein
MPCTKIESGVKNPHQYVLSTDDKYFIIFFIVFIFRLRLFFREGLFILIVFAYFDCFCSSVDFLILDVFELRSVSW